MAAVFPMPQPAQPALNEESCCWECGTLVPAPQRLHSMTSLKANICGLCEPWARETLKTEKGGIQMKTEQRYVRVPEELVAGLLRELIGDAYDLLSAPRPAGCGYWGRADDQGIAITDEDGDTRISFIDWESLTHIVDAVRAMRRHSPMLVIAAHQHCGHAGFEAAAKIHSPIQIPVVELTPA
jgi:hypothetical protein